MAGMNGVVMAYSNSWGSTRVSTARVMRAAATFCKLYTGKFHPITCH